MALVGFCFSCTICLMKCHRGTSTSMVRILTVSVLFVLFKLVEDAEREKKNTFSNFCGLLFIVNGIQKCEHTELIFQVLEKGIFFFCLKKMY